MPSMLCLHVHLVLPNKAEFGHNSSGAEIRAAGSEDDEDLGSAKLSPVVVFLHGGAFYTGTANSHIYGPDFLLREDVVLVTVQYRLGALGFLAAGSRDAPGNAGLKDQALALQWVQRNIRRFGGDPSSVTLLGHSAGGAAVHYHAMSPGSRGLFHRAVQLSGCALNAWAFATPAEA
ncbi:cholinesterase 1-like, partial [Thrips palmi]|uniref:Carboxylic ester hydrolase n=1 Tax=Thrips palmi TaxID=161013 RepID=A0A6P8ZYR2_THRPL